MRPIKFRIWLGNKFSSSSRYIHFKRGLIQTNYHEWIIELFSGLYDCKGKEIYEGDILTYEYAMGYVDWRNHITVIFKEGSFGYELDDGNGGSQFMALNLEKYKIIGNIHEHEWLVTSKPKFAEIE